MTFDQAYEAVLADTCVAKQIHYRVRYQVFCQEKQFESADAFPDGQEKDPWDPYSTHFLIREKAQGRWVAAMRMVQPGPDGFPVERIAALADALAPQRLSSGVCELSRLCLIKKQDSDYRLPPSRQIGDSCGVVGPSMSGVRESEIMLGLFRAALAFSEQHGVDYWYVLINKAFARLLKRLGVQLTQAGEPCLHRGIRTPYLVDLQAGRDFVSQCSCRVASVLNLGPRPYRRFSDLFEEANDVRLSSFVDPLPSQGVCAAR